MITIENREIIKRLRSEIVSNVARSRELRAEANAVRGIERHRIHLDRRYVGRCTRVLLLALAYIRNRPYLAIEARCAEKPDAYSIARNIETDQGANAARFREVRAAVEEWLAAMPATATRAATAACAEAAA